MTPEQYKSLYKNVSDNIYGQRIGLVYVNDFRGSIAKPYKDMGITKISTINGHIAKKSYYEMANTSTGLQELGVELKPKRESFYNYEKLNGFLANLKSDPNQKYVLLRFDDDPQRKNQHVIKITYVDRRGEPLDEKYVESLMTASALRSKHKEYGRAAKLDLSVGMRAYKWANIARLKIEGWEYVDKRFDKFLH